MELGPGPKVDEFDLKRPGVDEDVFVFDVSVNDAGLVDLHEGVDELPEHVLRQDVAHAAVVRYEVEQVFGVGKVAGGIAHAFHDDHVAVGQLEVVFDRDHACKIKDSDQHPGPEIVPGIRGATVPFFRIFSNSRNASPVWPTDCPRK